MPQMSLDPQSLRGLADFRVALRHFLAASEVISQGAGITQQQYQALLAIKTWRAEAMTMKDLAEQLLLTHHAAVQLVNRLARAGLAERGPSAGDRRSVLLTLTPAGDALVDLLAAEHLREMRRQGPLLAGALRRLRAIPPSREDGSEGP
jgi:DNA-binding MarR family transcriptional regulator